MTMSDQIDLLVEQVKMLAGEIAFSSSTLKRLLEQSLNDPDGSKNQVSYTFNLKKGPKQQCSSSLDKSVAC